MTANDRVRAIIQKLGIKQRDILEKEPRLKQNTLSLNLKNSDWPNGYLAAALSKYWGVNLNWIYTGEGVSMLQQVEKEAQISYLKQQLKELSSTSD